MNIKSFAERAGVSYYTLYEFLRREDHSLRDEDITKILNVLGYNLVPEEKRIVYHVCTTVSVKCEDVYVVPVYRKIYPDGKPDFSSQIGRVCSREPAYALEVTDYRAFPFTHRAVVVLYKLIAEIVGDGYYVFARYASNVPIIREVRRNSSALLFKLYNPDECEAYTWGELEEKGLKVVGRVLEFTVQVC